MQQGLQPSPNHHGSHNQLLASPDIEPQDIAPVDAIIVPTFRATEKLRTAIDLAAYQQCTLIALCSRDASAAAAADYAAERGVDIVAVDNPQEDLLPAFETTSLLRGTDFVYTRDTSVKRNLGLLLANVVGWRRVFFLDDDITVPDRDDLGRAAFLLDQYDAVGLRVGDFPDNSVVCHAHRESGGIQRTFIGVGALAVTPSATSFFPRVYNEDWFFLLDGVRLRPAAIVGSATQEAYDPYVDVDRARLEEFGDNLAEGVFWLLENGHDVYTADESYWKTALERRQKFIEEISARLDGTVPSAARRQRMRSALRAARKVHDGIEPQLCATFVAAWLRDRQLWSDHVNERRQKLESRPGWADQPSRAKLADALSEWEVNVADSPVG